MTKTILCLFDKSGIMGEPWINAGYRVICIDWECIEGRRGEMEFIKLDLRNRTALFELCEAVVPAMVISFPPCDDLAVSGSAHFAAKWQKDPQFQSKAIELFKTGELVSDKFKIPSLTENPVSVASSMYRPADAYWHPWEYGGYLPEDDKHPTWPEYIVPRDAYPKKTGAWLKGGMLLPEKRPVYCPAGYSKQHLKLGGKSKKTKIIRSLTPRGFALALYHTMVSRI